MTIILRVWGFVILVLVAMTAEAAPYLWAQRAETPAVLLFVTAYGVAPFVGLTMLLVRRR